jgi:hypothetical protein
MKEQEIKELANYLNFIKDSDDCYILTVDESKLVAEELYDAGYRKQAEADVEKIENILTDFGTRTVTKHSIESTARQLLPLLSPKPELKLISDKEIPLWVKDNKAEYIFMAGAQAQFSANKKAVGE